MKRIEFNNEISKAAFDVYASSTFDFYQDTDGTYYCSDLTGTEKYRIGNLEAVERFLEEIEE